jgi:short-subunit dehydrogenase
VTNLGHALITGAAGAIGAALAEVLRERYPALRLSLVDVDEEGARRTGERVGGDVAARRWDLAEPERLPALADELVATRGLVDLLVNCAGIMEVRSLAATPWELGERVLRVDLESPLRLMSLFARPMVEARRGTIVNVTSLAGVTPLRGCAFYGAAKAGLAMASEIARLELARQGVHVVTVYPGPIRSSLEKRARAQYGGASLARWLPAGAPRPLAERIVDACERRRPRVVYPPLYELASRFPGLASGLTRALSPAAADR